MERESLVPSSGLPPSPKKGAGLEGRGGYRRKLGIITRHAIASLFWSYVILKLFVLDVDVVLARRFFPGATWLVDYRGVLVLCILAILAIVAWNFKLLGWVVYILVYPGIAMLWHLPSLLVRRRAWVLSVALVASFISAARYLRSTIILAALFSLGALLIAVGVSSSTLGFGMLFLFVFLVFLYSVSIRESFRSSLTALSSRSLDKIWSFISMRTTAIDELRGVDVQAMTEVQQSLWVTHLQISILYGRVCSFLAEKLRNLRRGRITAAISSLKVATLFATTVVTFSFLNIGLFKSDNSQYMVEHSVRGFDFLWYTFQASFMNNISEIAPKGILARSIFMVNEVTSGLILFVIFVSFLAGVNATRNAEEMDAVIKKMKDQVAVSERYVLDQFGLTVPAAVQELIRQRLKAAFIGWILRLSPDLEPPEWREITD